jgi:hypothetical protein
LEEVTGNFRRVEIWSDQVRLIEGWFNRYGADRASQEDGGSYRLVIPDAYL